MFDPTYSKIYLSGFAAGKEITEESIREANRKKIIEGVATAKERGVRFGRPPKPRPKEFEQFKAMWLDGKISSTTAAKKLGIAQDTFARWCRDTKPKKMQVEEALIILREVSGRLDNEKDGDVIEAIEVVNQYIIENRKKRTRRMERTAKAKMEQTGGDGSESDIDGSTGRISAN